MLNEMLSKTRWFTNRDAYLKHARELKELLTNLDGRFGYSKDDERVKSAVSNWVDRARNAHAFAMGRKPVIPNAVVIDRQGMTRGAMYAK